MKFFTASYKNKKSGLSLLLAMIGSTLALGVVVFMVAVITRSVEQSQDLERSTQVFFAIESGLEAGFFHHNARGQGVQFVELSSVPQEQTITHSYTNLDSSWTIDGRAADVEFDGLIYENTPLQLRWFWDNSVNVTKDPNIINEFPSFTLTLNPDNTIDGFNFDTNSGQEEVLLSWFLTKSDPGIMSLSSKTDDPLNICGATNSFICSYDLFSSPKILNSSPLRGTLLPRQGSLTEETIDSFINTGTNFQLVLTPSLKFEDAFGDKIAGIPFHITGNTPLPRPNYSVFTSVTAGDFTKELTLENIPEQTAIQAFNYVIFE